MLQFVFVFWCVSKVFQLVFDSLVLNFIQFSLFFNRKDILWFLLSFSRVGRFRNIGRWSLKGERRIPGEEGAVKLVQIWSRREGDAIELWSGNRVGRDI